MTARVCPIHGEYSQTGVCRWCEKPSVEVDAAVDDMRVAGYFEPSGINAKWGESPSDSALRDVAALKSAMDAAWLRLNTYGSATMFFPDERDEPYIDAETHAAEQSRLLAQHAALRWERVARRWEAKANSRSYEFLELVSGVRCPCGACVADLLESKGLDRKFTEPPP